MLATALRAGDLESRSGVESEVASTAHWVVRLRGEARSNDHYQNVSNARGHSDINYVPHRHIALVSITQFLQTQVGPAKWQATVRQLSGGELLFRTTRLGFSARSIEEHFFQPGHDYDRFRQRGLVRLRKINWQPQTGAELFLDGQGWATTRLIFGVLAPCGRHLQFDAGYYYEFRPVRQGGDRHVIYTYFNLRRPRG